MDEERYVDGFKPYMMDVVKAWVDGQSFASICQMTSIYEGNFINKKDRYKFESSPRIYCTLYKTT